MGLCWRCSVSMRIRIVVNICHSRQDIRIMTEVHILWEFTQGIHLYVGTGKARNGSI